MIREWMEAYRVTRMIHKAIDTYPDGICFARQDGRVVLANQKINAICGELTGHTVMNTHEIWQELLQRWKEESKGTNAGLARPEEQELTFVLADGRIWRFRRRRIPVRRTFMVQIEAADVTELTGLREQLRKDNLQMAALHERQRELLKSIVQNNLEQELLNAKMRIHDEFGRLLLMTRDSLQEATAEKDETLLKAWAETAKTMEHMVLPDRQRQSPQAELKRVAEMIGCRLVLRGEEPRERKALLLMYAAIREALTNAIRHAGADELTVQIKEEQDGYRIRIRDNGIGGAFPIREGSGLSALRTRLEQEGATLRYEYDEGLILVLSIPKEEQDERTDRGGLPDFPGSV